MLSIPTAEQTGGHAAAPGMRTNACATHPRVEQEHERSAFTGQSESQSETRRACCCSVFPSYIGKHLEALGKQHQTRRPSNPPRAASALGIPTRWSVFLAHLHTHTSYRCMKLKYRQLFDICALRAAFTGYNGGTTGRVGIHRTTEKAARRRNQCKIQKERETMCRHELTRKRKYRKGRAKAKGYSLCHESHGGSGRYGQVQP